jgi:hypothetical protein
MRADAEVNVLNEGVTAHHPFGIRRRLENGCVVTDVETDRRTRDARASERISRVKGAGDFFDQLNFDLYFALHFTFHPEPSYS